MDKHDHEEEWKFQREEEALGNVLSIGDNFAVLANVANKEGVEFYVLQCQRPKFVVSEAFNCVLGSRFDAGDSMVARTYYQQWGPSNRSYITTKKWVHK